MFTGIVESLGIVEEIEQDGTNTHFVVSSDISHALKVDQSVMHNGACLTVIARDSNTHKVTAIKETMLKTNLGTWSIGDSINLERSMMMNGRLDGHIVQGHVDTVGLVEDIQEENGSWRYYFSYSPSSERLTVSKGSICVNGVSLTVVDSEKDRFSVAIIPYTYEHTNFKNFKRGDQVNLEFDILGKYFARFMELYR